MCAGENISTIHTDAQMKILQGLWVVYSKQWGDRFGENSS